MSAKYSNLLSKLKPEQKPLQPETTETQTENLKSSDSVFDLSEHLSHQPTPAPVTGSTEETKTEETEKPEETNFEDVERAAINTLIDPDMIAEGLADITNLLREMAYPKIYEQLMFKPHERKLLQNPQTLNENAAKFLNVKLDDFNQHVKKIEWDVKEKAQMVKHIFRPLADKLGPDSAITKYYPLLIVAAIEGKRFKAVANSSSTIYVEDKPAEQPKNETRPPFTVTTTAEPVKEEAEEQQTSETVNLSDYNA